MGTGPILTTGEKMEKFQCCLSVEEIAAAIAASGKQDEANGFLIAAFPQMSPGEGKGRLLTASHSLIAREFLSVEGEKAFLQPKVQEIIDGILNSKYLLRANRTAETGEDILTFMKIPSGWLEQSSSGNSVSCFRIPVSTPELIGRVQIFFKPSFDSSFLGQRYPLQEKFFELTAQQRRDASYLKNTFSQFTSLQNAAMMSNEIAHAKWRGTFLQFSVQSQSKLFLIQGEHTLWKIETDGNKNQLFMIPLSENDLNQYFSLVIR
jgi:hypothetical protein